MASNEVVIRITGRDDSGDAFDKAEKRATSWMSKLSALLSKFSDWLSARFSRAGRDAGENLADGLWRSADGRLRDSTGRFAKMGEDAAIAAAFGFTDIFTKMFSAGAGLGAMTLSTGGMNLLAGAFLALLAAVAAAAAALIAFAPVLLLVGGLFGSAATAGFGLAATIATLVMGFGGLGEAWTAFGQKSAGGGRSAAAAAREVEAATYALAQAQKEAQRASEGVTRAREDETERLEDLTRSLARASLNEEAAVLAVARARQRLKDARRSGSGLDRQEAELGYRESLLSLEEVRDRLGDLRREKAEADRNGVEGSDRVQAAIERQERAQRGLIEATQRLSEAQSGAGGGVDKFAQAMAGLSANGQALINTLIGLKPRFDELKRATQDRMLAGLDQTLKDLATVWLPVLGPMLGNLADSLNKVFKGLANAFSKPQFIIDMHQAMAGWGRIMERLGEGVEALIGAFGRLARGSLPFFEKFADLIAGSFENFERWITAADESGELTKFMEDAAQALQDIWDIGGLVVDIFKELAEIFMGPSMRESDSFLEGVKTTLTGMKLWLEDPQNQQKIRDFITELQNLGDAVVNMVMTIADWVAKIDGWITKIGEFLAAVEGMPGKIRAASAGMWDGLKDSFKAALNWIIDRWNGLSVTIPKMSLFGQEFGGNTIGLGKFQRLATGGISSGLAQVAERGREMIRTPDGGMLLAMPNGSTVYPNGMTENMLSRNGSGGVVRVQVDVTGGDDVFRRWIQKQVKVFGDGNVQVAYGTGSA